MKGKTNGKAIAPDAIPRALLEKLERFWWEGSKVSGKIAAKALATKDHETAIIWSTFSIAFQNAAMHLYGLLHRDELLKKLRHRPARRRP